MLILVVLEWFSVGKIDGLLYSVPAFLWFSLSRRSLYFFHEWGKEAKVISLRRKWKPFPSHSVLTYCVDSWYLLLAENTGPDRTKSLVFGVLQHETDMKQRTIYKRVWISNRDSNGNQKTNQTTWSMWPASHAFDSRGRSPLARYEKIQFHSLAFLLWCTKLNTPKPAI